MRMAAFVLLSALVALVGGTTLVATAQPALPPNATVVASGLINPRGFTFAPDGTLVIAESGAVPDGFVPLFGPPTPMFLPAATTTGRVSRVDLTTGSRTTIADGLPSSAGSFGDTLGPANVAYLDGELYVLMSTGPVHGWPNFPSGVYKVNPNGTLRLVANLDAFNSRNPVALITPDDEISNPYDMVAADGALWITDGNRAQVYKVTPQGAVSRVVDLSAGHPVVTGIAAASFGGFITVELTAVPYLAGSGRILHINPDGETQLIAQVTTVATGVAVGGDGTIYVTEHSVSLGKPPFMAPNTGRVTKLTSDGQLQALAEGLLFPTITRIGPDGALYLANTSVTAEKGEGQILRFNGVSGS